MQPNDELNILKDTFGLNNKKIGNKRLKKSNSEKTIKKLRGQGPNFLTINFLT